MGSSKVLDLDMDFFLADCCPLADVGERPSVFGHEPWSEGAVRKFLEENCGLDARRPIKGRLCFGWSLLKKESLRIRST